MKSLQAPNFKTIALTKVMCTTIRSYADEPYDDITEERRRKKLTFESFIVDTLLRPVPSQGIVR